MIAQPVPQVLERFPGIFLRLCIEQADMKEDDDEQRQIGDGGVVKKDISNDGDIGQDRDTNGRELALGDRITIIQV